MCEYCKIIKKEKEAQILYEDDVVIVFVKSRRHIVTVPREHFSSLEEVSDDILAYMFIIANRVSTLLFEATKSQGTNMLINNGKSANQEVEHISIDTIFRLDKDDLNFTWNTKQIEQDKLLSYQEKFVDNINKEIVQPVKKEEPPPEKEVISEIQEEKKEPSEDYRIKQLIRIP